MRNTWKCAVWDHDVSFTSHGRTMVWECRRGCGTGGSKKYASSSQAARFATAFDRRDRADLGRRAPLLGMFPAQAVVPDPTRSRVRGGGDGMSGDVKTGEIITQVPARLDRLPWAHFHWRVVVGLGSVWILDGLEVTMVGSVAARLTERGSGIDINAGQIGTAAAIYIVGACLGALFFGQLTDRFGRKKLFMLTLGVYIVATVSTAFAFAPWYFYLARFVTGAGIGGEYAAINSAIDELIPARVRGRVDLAINGSYWVGSAAGAAAALLLLDTRLFAADVGWRLAFGMGAVLGLLVLLVRRNVPESPRWLFIHGREDEAERIVGDIEEEVTEETQEELSEPEDSLTVRQREHIPFREIAKVAFAMYPRRAFLGLALFVGQAFIYNGVTFNLGTLLSGFYGVASGMVPLFIIIWALSNFAGPLHLGPTLRHGGSQTDDRGNVHRVRPHRDRPGARPGQRHRERVALPCRPGSVLLLGILRCQRRVPHGQRDLPDGDPCPGHRVLLRRGNRDRRHHRATAFRAPDQLRGPRVVSIAFYIGAAVMILGGVVEIFLGDRRGEVHPRRHRRTPHGRRR